MNYYIPHILKGMLVRTNSKMLIEFNISSLTFKAFQIVLITFFLNYMSIIYMSVNVKLSIYNVHYVWFAVCE